MHKGRWTLELPVNQFAIGVKVEPHHIVNSFGSFTMWPANAEANVACCGSLLANRCQARQLIDAWLYM